MTVSILARDLHAWQLTLRSRWLERVMTPLRAHVHNGRIVLNESARMPEGELIYLRPAGRQRGRGR